MEAVHRPGDAEQINPVFRRNSQLFFPSKPMSLPSRVAITCFPTFGGSGMVATGVGLAMAERGHRRPLRIAQELPVRLGTPPRA